jgi:hypothetical protein
MQGETPRPMKQPRYPLNLRIPGQASNSRYSPAILVQISIDAPVIRVWDAAGREAGPNLWQRGADKLLSNGGGLNILFVAPSDLNRGPGGDVNKSSARPARASARSREINPAQCVIGGIRIVLASLLYTGWNERNSCVIPSSMTVYPLYTNRPNLTLRPGKKKTSPAAGVSVWR